MYIFTKKRQLTTSPVDNEACNAGKPTDESEEINRCWTLEFGSSIPAL